MTTFLGIGSRPTPVLFEEHAESAFGRPEVFFGIERPEYLVLGDLGVEGVGQAGEGVGTADLVIERSALGCGHGWEALTPPVSSTGAGGLKPHACPPSVDAVGIGGRRGAPTSVVHTSDLRRHPRFVVHDSARRVPLDASGARTGGGMTRRSQRQVRDVTVLRGEPRLLRPAHESPESITPELTEKPDVADESRPAAGLWGRRRVLLLNATTSRSPRSPCAGRSSSSCVNVPTWSTPRPRAWLCIPRRERSRSRR